MLESCGRMANEKGKGNGVFLLSNLRELHAGSLLSFTAA
jgi:hypothetical protein